MTDGTELEQSVKQQIDPKPESPALVVDQQAKKGARPRNYSFQHRDPDTLGTAKVGGDDNPDHNAQVYSIPAHIGSVFWAILKVCYEHANQPVYADDLFKMVDELMRDRDEANWENYINKEQTTVFRRGEQKRLVQKIKPAKERVINNAKTLTRQGGDSPYGKRLMERGHVLRYQTDSHMKPFFTLFTSIEAATKKQVEVPKPDKVE